MVPPSLLYNWHRLCFPGVKRPGRGVSDTPQSSAEVKVRVELYLYSPFVACSRANFTFTFTQKNAPRILKSIHNCKYVFF